MLQIQQYQIRYIKQISNLIAFIVAICIECSMQIPAFLHFREQLLHEMCLECRLTA
ncbi:hypothetical protein D3C79_908570 [compost metagenome]